MATDLGATSPLCAVPHPDTQDPRNMWEGTAKRFISQPPTPDRGMRRRLRKFVKDWCKRNLTPLGPETDISFETWIADRPYPEWRKQELREVYQTILKDGLSKDWKKVNSFGKEEYLVSQEKTLRAINSRSDEFKVLSGPLFKAIENEVFKHEAFIKKVPVPDRPAYIKERFNVLGGQPSVSDYSSFETHFTADTMRDIEFVLYEYMTQYVPSDFKTLLNVLVGQNVCRFKWFTVFVEATRMSGEMCTSLGNGFSNLMIGLFAAHEHGATQVVAVVEGDDGLFLSNATNSVTTEWFAQLGFTIKMENVSLEESSFCGLLFDPDELINVCDPIDAMLTVGWSSGRYVGVTETKRKSLLRAKAISMYYQYNGCPMLTELSLALMRLTRGSDLRWVLSNRNLSLWDRENLLSALQWMKNAPEPRKPGIKTRLLVESKFGITVEHQLQLERHFAAMKTVKDFHHPLMTVYCPDDWLDYTRKYVIPRPLGTGLYFPALPLTRSDERLLPYEAPAFVAGRARYPARDH